MVFGLLVPAVTADGTFFLLWAIRGFVTAAAAVAAGGLLRRTEFAYVPIAEALKATRHHIKIFHSMRVPLYMYSFLGEQETHR